MQVVSEMQQKLVTAEEILNQNIFDILSVRSQWELIIDQWQGKLVEWVRGQELELEPDIFTGACNIGHVDSCHQFRLISVSSGSQWEDHQGYLDSSLHSQANNWLVTTTHCSLLSTLKFQYSVLSLFSCSGIITKLTVFALQSIGSCWCWHYKHHNYALPD